MSKQPEVLRDAQTLAKFSNLDTAESVDYFRNNFEGFVPEDWWDIEITIEPREITKSPDGIIFGPPGAEEGLKVWLKNQRELRETWQTRFPLENCVRLISEGAIPYYLLAATQTQPSPLFRRATVWPYQRAIMFLATESWRVRFCENCGNRYVAEKSSRHYCSVKCTSEARKQSRRTWWGQHGENWRAGRSKSKQKEAENSKTTRRKA
jgi:hypothetical protein